MKISTKSTQNDLAKLGRRSKLKRNLQIYSLGIIPLLLIFIFSYIPMFGIIIAFKNYRFDRGIFGSEWVGLENFKVFVQSKDFLNITWNTVYLNTIFIVCGMICAMLLAVILYEVTSRKTTKVYQTVFLTPHFLSWVVVSYMAYAILSPTSGTLNVLLQHFGMNKIDWYSTPSAWPFILTVCSIWKHMGMDSIMYYAALMGIDSALFEVAKIEGANWRQKMKYVIIPCLKPLITLLFIMKIGGIFRADFGLFYQVTRNIGKLYDVTDVLDTYIFRTMRVLGDMGISSAAGLMQSFVGMAVVMLTNAIVKKIEPENALF